MLFKKSEKGTYFNVKLEAKRFLPDISELSLSQCRPGQDVAIQHSTSIVDVLSHIHQGMEVTINKSFSVLINPVATTGN